MLPIKSADLCSGLGLHAWWSQGFAKPAIYCEICPKARALLLSGMGRGVIPEAPVHDDLCTVKLEAGTEFVTCSWPCQGAGFCWGAWSLAWLERPHPQASQSRASAPATTTRGPASSFACWTS